jgi:hypothetical protein
LGKSVQHKISPLLPSSLGTRIENILCLESAVSLLTFQQTPSAIQELADGEKDDRKSALTSHRRRFNIRLMADSVQIQKNLRAAMKEALRIQDRFVAEPVFAKTGRGYLKSEGVTTIHKIKANLRRSTSPKSG